MLVSTSWAPVPETTQPACVIAHRRMPTAMQAKKISRFLDEQLISRLGVARSNLRPIATEPLLRQETSSCRFAHAPTVRLLRGIRPSPQNVAMPGQAIPAHQKGFRRHRSGIGVAPQFSASGSVFSILSSSCRTMKPRRPIEIHCSHSVN
jgi:hypothetical protein